MLRRQPVGWVVLALLMAAFSVLHLLDAIWGATHGDPWRLAVLPMGLAFYYWIGMGAWRRTVELPRGAARPRA